MTSEPIVYWWTLPLLYIGWDHLSFEGCWVNFVPFTGILILMETLIANSVDPDQMPHYVASDLGLRCLL